MSVYLVWSRNGEASKSKRDLSAESHFFGNRTLFGFFIDGSTETLDYLRIPAFLRIDLLY